MAIVKKTGLFYELLIRGNWDPKQGQLGAITTYQLQTGAALIDEDANELAAPYAPDPPRDLSRDEAAAYLGEQLAGFLDQLASERAAAARAQAELQVKLDAASQQIVDLQKRISNAHALLTAAE